MGLIRHWSLKFLQHKLGTKKFDEQIAEARKNFNQALAKFKYEDRLIKIPDPSQKYQKLFGWKTNFRKAN